MARLSTCPKCGATIDRQGWCVRSACIYSEEYTRKEDGPRATPPFA